MSGFDAIPMVPTGMGPPADGSVYAVMQGELVIAGSRLRVYQLSTGQRVINEDDVNEFFGPELMEAIR